MGSQPKEVISITKTQRQSQPASEEKNFIRQTIKVASNLGHLIGQPGSKLTMADYFHYVLPKGEGGEWVWEVTRTNNGSREGKAEGRFPAGSSGQASICSLHGWRMGATRL